MMVKKTKDPEEIIQFASMWNMDGLVVFRRRSWMQSLE